MDSRKCTSPSRYPIHIPLIAAFGEYHELVKTNGIDDSPTNNNNRYALDEARRLLVRVHKNCPGSQTTGIPTWLEKNGKTVYMAIGQPDIKVMSNNQEFRHQNQHQQYHQQWSYYPLRAHTRIGDSASESISSKG